MAIIIIIKIKITTVIVRIVAERSYSFDVNNGDNCGKNDGNFKHNYILFTNDYKYCNN